VRINLARTNPVKINLGKINPVKINPVKINLARINRVRISPVRISRERISQANVRVRFNPGSAMATIARRVGRGGSMSSSAAAGTSESWRRSAGTIISTGRTGSATWKR
jgi:hypothetical protein